MSDEMGGKHRRPEYVPPDPVPVPLTPRHPKWWLFQGAMLVPCGPAQHRRGRHHFRQVGQGPSRGA